MVIFVLLIVAFQIWGPKKQEQKQQTAESSQQAAHLNQPASAVNLHVNSPLVFVR